MELTPYLDLMLWAGACIVLVVSEIFTAGFFFMFFAVGAGAAVLVSLFTHNWMIQSAIFLAVSILSLIYAKPLLKTTLNITDEPTLNSNEKALIGTEALVLETVEKHEGRVKVAHTGETWSAFIHPDSEQDSLAEGEEGIIVNVDGAKLAIRSK